MTEKMLLKFGNFLKDIGALSKNQNVDKFINKYKVHNCNHELIPHGWSHTKCRKCNIVNRNDENYNQVYSEYIKRRSEGMKNAGFDDITIAQENSKIHP